MRTVQLDKNAGGKKLREYCNQDGAVECFLLPPAVRDAGDADVADFGVRHGNLTLTFDKGFMLNAAPRIVGINPGILPMRTDDNSFEQVSTKTAPKMLRAFKEQFPEWHEVPWLNTILELTPTLIIVYQTWDVPPKKIELLKRDEEGWQNRLKELLQQNAHGPLAKSLGHDSQ